MPQEVFMDASAWVALFDPTDQHHQEAEQIYQEIAHQDWLMCTTNWTLYEAATTLACHRRRHDWALRLLDKAQEAVDIVKGEEVEQQAIQTFRSHRDKFWSVIDCANFHIIQQRNSSRAFAFDQHFRQAQGEFRFSTLP